MTRRYRLFGLTVDSDLLLADVPAADRDGPANAEIRVGKVADDVPVGAVAYGPFFHGIDGMGRLGVPGIGRFLVADGQRILVDPDPAADAADLSAHLLGTCLGLLLAQRGHLVLHGAAIDVGGRAVVCLGRSGAGKSTLAAAFARRGFNVLTDDLCPIDGQGRVVPGLSRVKLWRDSAAMLGLDPSEMRPVRPGLDKYVLPLGEAWPPHDGEAAAPLTVGAVYVLRHQPRVGGEMTRVDGVARLKPLRHHSYRLGCVDAMGMAGRHLIAIAGLANRPPLTLLSRPAGSSDPDHLVDVILADQAAAGAGGGPS